MNDEHKSDGEIKEEEDNSLNNDNSQIQNEASVNLHDTKTDDSLTTKPIINLPRTLSLIITFLLLIHVVMTNLPETYIADVYFYVSFIPQRITQIIFYDAKADFISKLAIFYTLISYTFLHGDWSHLLLNMAGIVIFGKLVISRLGVIRFLLFSGFSAVFSILVHYGFNLESYIPVIGISGVIYAYIGASMRFILYRKDTAILFRLPNFDFDRLPRLSIFKSLMQKTNLSFLIFLLLMNLVLPQFVEDFKNMAYIAHLGGLFFGLAFFQLFDRN